MDNLLGLLLAPQHTIKLMNGDYIKATLAKAFPDGYVFVVGEMVYLTGLNKNVHFECTFEEFHSALSS